MNPAWLLRIPEERSVCRRKKRSVATLAFSCRGIAGYCKLTLAILELIGQTEAQAEALAREWCCWDAIDTGSFVGSPESTMSTVTCSVLRELYRFSCQDVGWVRDM